MKKPKNYKKLVEAVIKDFSNTDYSPLHTEYLGYDKNLALYQFATISRSVRGEYGLIIWVDYVSKGKEVHVDDAEKHTIESFNKKYTVFKNFNFDTLNILYRNKL